MSMFKRALAGLGEGMVEIANSNIQNQQQTARDKALFVQQERLAKMRQEFDGEQRKLDREQDQSQFETSEKNRKAYQDGNLRLQKGELDRKTTNDRFDRFDSTLKMYVGAVQKLDEAWGEESSFLDPQDAETQKKYQSYVDRRQQLSERINHLAAANPDVAEHYGFKPPPETDTQNAGMSDSELAAEQDYALKIAEDLGVPGVGKNPASAEPETDPVQAEREAMGVTSPPSIGEEVSGLFSKAKGVYDEAMASDAEARKSNWWKQFGGSVVKEFTENRSIHNNTAAKMAEYYSPQQMQSMGVPSDLITYVSTFKPGYKPGTATPPPTPTTTAAAGVPQ